MQEITFPIITKTSIFCPIIPEKNQVKDPYPLKKENRTPKFVHFKNLYPLLLRLCRPSPTAAASAPPCLCSLCRSLTWPTLVTRRVPMTHLTEHLGTAPLLFHQSRILMRRMYFLTEVLIIFVRNLKTIILLHKFCAIAILIDIDTKKTTSRDGIFFW